MDASSPASSSSGTPPPPLERVRDENDGHNHDHHHNRRQRQLRDLLRFFQPRGNDRDDHDDEEDNEEADDASAGGLATRLAPWLECVWFGDVRWAPLPTHGGRLGVAVELRADVTEAALDEDDEFEHLLQLREAVDLVALALAVEPAALRAMLRERDHEWIEAARPMTPEREDAIESVVAHGARAELRLRLEFRGLHTRLFEDQLVPRFLHPRDAPLPATRGFRRLRNELVERLKTDEATLARANRLTVPVTVAVDSGPIRQVSLLDADDFFVHLAAFSRAVASNRADATRASSWRVDAETVPLEVDLIELTMRRFCITHRVTQAVKAFMAAGTPVRVTQLNLDPRLISCADQDVRDFVATLTKGATGLRVDTGVAPDEEFVEAIDEHDQDRRATIQVILSAIAEADGVRELNLGGLLTLCVASHNRRAVWRYLFSHILARDVVPETLTFEDSVIFEDEERDWFREEAAQWRERHPGRKLFIKSLNMRLQATESDILEQFLLAIDDVETFRLTHRDSNEFSPRVLHRLLAFPSLKRLKMERLIVPTMDLFVNPDVQTKPALEELALDDLTLQDKSSMVRFLEKLRWDVSERSALATTLRRFSVGQSSLGWNEAYIWDRDALDALDRALETNRVLKDARMVMDFGEDFYGEFQARLDRHNRIPLPATPAVRNSDVVRARNLAFLSVIRSEGESARSLLDAAAVSRVFEFAAPHQMRKVDLQPWDEY